MLSLPNCKSLGEPDFIYNVFFPKDMFDSRDFAIKLEKSLVMKTNEKLPGSMHSLAGKKIAFQQAVEKRREEVGMIGASERGSEA